MTAVIMQAMCCRQNPRRMKYQPAEMRTVLSALRDAFNAGRSEMVMRRKVSASIARTLYDLPTAVSLSRSFRAERSGVEESRGVTFKVSSTGSLDFAREDYRARLK